MKSFSARVLIIGINPYVRVPKPILLDLFASAGRTRGPLPVRGALNGKRFTQTVVKYRRVWRLYLNTEMRSQAGLDVGDLAKVRLEFDAKPPTTPMHPRLAAALSRNRAASQAFHRLSPSRQKEILRYLHSLKGEEAIGRNVRKVIEHLLGTGRGGPAFLRSRKK
ncbi:MAG TPA: YdeI/OmpD-associated family protein [Anaerolineales bacterium]|nr:YdeI/OmpD-associated family protein [Anaerolineales bacterium]